MAIMTPRTKSTITVAVISLLAVVAAWGWMRKPAANGANYASGQAMGYYPNAAPPAQATNSNPGYAGEGYPAGYDNGQAAMSNGTYSYTGNGPNPCISQAMYVPPEIPAYASRGYVRTVRQQPVTETRTVTRYVERDRPLVYRERSKKKSALIVGSSAGAGAAIGALAGGGKGAAIGALTGGVGGFIYDRLTHRHRVR